MSLDQFPWLYESYAETRTVAVTLAQGNFKYEVLETVGAESPQAGPAIPRSKFAVGETVYVHYRIRNDGAVKAKASIAVKDKDTGAAITTYTTGDIGPNERGEIFKAVVGTMPNKNWNLEFAMTP